ncbi:MAG: membrane protein insertase YidC, partial [Planctomycetota bacterium]
RLRSVPELPPEETASDASQPQPSLALSGDQGEGAMEASASDPSQEEPTSSKADAEAESSAAPAADMAPAVPAWTEWVEVGADGEIGHMWVLFDSYGGGIAEIRNADHFVRQGLTDEEKLERENMVPIVQQTVENFGVGENRLVRRFNSLMIRPSTAAAAIFTQDPSRVNWQHERLDEGVLFTHADPSGVTVTKRIEHVTGQNHFDVTLTVETTNPEFQNKRYAVNFIASVGMPEIGADSFYVEPKAVAALVDRDIKDVSPDPDGQPRQELIRAGRLEFFGTHNKYFAMIARPVSDSARTETKEASLERIFDTDWAAVQQAAGEPYDEGFRDVLVDGRLDLSIPTVGAAPASYKYTVYAGPKDPEQFTPEDEVFQKIIDEDLGFFDGIAKLILGFLRFLHGILGNWGWAIIFLTLTVRLMLFPLNRRMQTAMARHGAKMKRVQPKIDAIKKKYADKPQQLRQEQAKLFQEEGVMPPLGGCLPLFLQIPIFFGLFSALRVSFDLRHQPFTGWIKDLSQPDRLARIDLNTHLPIIGTIEWFNLLPILMVVLWIGQQRVMPKPQAQDEQARQMQKIMMWMPIMFGFFLYNYAAGLSLYMITTSAFGIIESTVIRKIWPIDDTEKPKKKGKFMQRLEELQKQAVAQQEMRAREQAKSKKKGR